MDRLKKTICLLTIVCLVSGLFVMPANASDDPLAVKDFEQFGAPDTAEPETTAAEEIPPEETVSEETVEETTEATEAPTEATEVPTEATEAPTEATEVPTEATEEPTEATEELTEPTEAPTEPTEASTEPTEETVAPEQPEETEELNEREFPLYFQTDYPNVRFGSGTVANNGCSITSLAMVATYMTGHEYLPDELARYFGGRAENNIARLEMGSEALKLPYRKAENWHETYAALEAGKLAIIMVDNRTPFTQSQHFIIVTGINDAGKLVVYDSYEPNYEKWDLKQGFAEGFDPDLILQGYSGAWIYDPDAMPEEPFIYYEPDIDRSHSRYPGVQLTLEQEDLLASVIWVEARGECQAGQQAVAEVVLNRLVSDRFPDNLNDVIYGEGQFRSAKFLEDAEPYQTQYEAIERALYGPNVLPMDVYYFATTPKTSKVWGGIGGHIFCYAED